MPDINTQKIINKICNLNEAELMEYDFSYCFQALNEYDELKKQNSKMLDVLETLENDNNQLPAWLWEKVKATISSVKGE